MEIYKVHGGKIHSCEVSKETERSYWFDTHLQALGWSLRIAKEDACLTPQEAIQEALNGRRTMKGAFEDKLAAVSAEIFNLERLEREYSV